MKDNEIFSDSIEDWAFCYNIHTSRWEGFPKNKMREYNNGELIDGEFLQSSNMKILQRYITIPEIREFDNDYKTSIIKKR